MIRARHWRAAAGEGGFTLLELLVVMAVLALGLSLVVPAVNRTRAGAVARSAAYELAANLRAVRAAARASNMEHSLTIDLSGHRYWAEGVVAPRRMPSTVAVELTVPQSERIGARVGRVRFFPDGSTSGARLVLRDARSSASIAVDWLSGDVRLKARP
jgi:general secretion pathway protein H